VLFGAIVPKEAVLLSTTLVRLWLTYSSSSPLTNRSQFTSIDQHCSSVVSVKCGVPQGSVLGPILFWIYMNDISNSFACSKITLFADDTNMFVAAKSIY